ncbi:MAG: type III-A CRISPR-associated RAMP protein Csm5 [Smithella sp.]|jgi:CRISPR-associated protein Csm5
MRTYKLSCEILSPIHIGAGHELSPLDYIIKDSVLHKISFEKFVLSMDDNQRAMFEKLIEKGNLVDIRKYVSDHFKGDTDMLYSVKVSPQVGKLYSTKLEDIQNQLIINPFIRTQGEVAPLIPGSSLKGAIRTAVVSEQAKRDRPPKPTTPREEYEFEARVLLNKDAKDDPFRAIKVRDVLMQNAQFVVREIKNMSRAKQGRVLKANSIQMICEVSGSRMTGQPIAFETGFLIDDALISTHFLSKALSVNEIIHACKVFYRDKMEKEHKKFYADTEAQVISRQILDMPLDDNSFFLRVGRFSGVESVTIDEYRNPRPPQGKGWGDTRNLAEGLYPMGWIKATLVNP